MGFPLDISDNSAFYKLTLPSRSQGQKRQKKSTEVLNLHQQLKQQSPAKLKGVSISPAV